MFTNFALSYINFDFQTTDNTKLPYLVTDEGEQNKMIDYLRKKCPDSYAKIHPGKIRSIDDVARLVFGIHDKTDNEKEHRKKETEKIAELLKVCGFSKIKINDKQFQILEEAKNSNSKISQVLKKSGKTLV